MRRTALHWACQMGHARVVELLVEHGANTKVRWTDVWSTVNMRLILQQMLSVTELLSQLEGNADSAVGEHEGSWVRCAVVLS